MTKKNSFVALMLALTVIFAILSSVLFITAEADHDCTGDDCSICYRIDVCKNTLKNIGQIKGVIFLSVVIFNFALFLFLFEKKHIYNSSLVSLKIKLSD